MKRGVFLIFFLTVVKLDYANVNNNETTKSVDLSIIDISQQLLLAAKTKEPTDSLVNIIKSITETNLETQLNNDNTKKAFWINLYNASTQVLLSKNIKKYKDRSSFFGDKQIEIAGERLSLDNNEHGILRHSKLKWSLGYLNKLFSSAFEKKNRVDTLDYRIHFALNCGQKAVHLSLSTNRFKLINNSTLQLKLT